jgi:polyribonucleotide nucleotidyltransferase
VEKVEDVLHMGQELSVIVMDIDDQGKISLAMAGDDTSKAPREEDSDRGESDSSDNHDDTTSSAKSDSTDSQYVVFEDEFNEEIASELGDLGYASERPFASPKRNFRPGGPRRRGGPRR